MRERFGARQDVPIDQRLIGQLSSLTIRDISAALVELITNADDSYRRLEEAGLPATGKIEVKIEREIGGNCAQVEVRDFAEGMSRRELKRAVIFAGETSGFVQGRNVRGLFGRGLKEAIFALGCGDILTIRDGVFDQARLYRDDGGRCSLKLLEEPRDADRSVREELGIEDDGTLVSIRVTNPDIRVPTYRTYKPRLEQHYALRDILSSSNRQVELTFVDKGGRSRRRRGGPVTSRVTLNHEPPDGSLVEDTAFVLPDYGDEVHLKILESPEELEFGRYDAHSEAGILIKTTGAILDNQLFDYHNEPAAYFFFGSAYCPGIARRVREGEETLIDPNRGGLRWSSDYCKVLEAEITSRLDELVAKKEKELRRRQRKKIPKLVRRRLKELIEVLNVFAEKQFEWDIALDSDPDTPVDRLTIKPLVARVRPEEPRSLSVYAPADRYDDCTARVESDNPRIEVLTPEVELRECKRPGTIRGSFRVYGDMKGQEGMITCRLGRDEAYAKVTVAEFKKRGRTGEVTGTKKGMLREIVFDERSNPSQPSWYDKGVIRIYVNFPAVMPYLGSSRLEGVGRPEGKAILADLISEAFCRALTRKAFESGMIGHSPVPGGEIDAFNNWYNKYRRRYSGRIHELITGWEDISDLVDG